MANQLEHWHRVIREKPGTEVTETFYITDQELVGDQGVGVQYLSVTGENPPRLPEGVFVETNVAPESYNASMELRNLIRTYVTLALMDTTRSSESVIDYANAISFRQAFMTGAGALVMELTPGTREQVDQHIQGVEFGKTRMKFVPRNP